ncbi:hypothetical protein HV461_12435 [Bacillus sporothermodurans]|uniref:Uncharacterized protein n=1 Tax=Heyndrickxia sporothermodurans TaxID=46224 RepID=A0AB37HIE8_9BACI|nr:hypothetical protein [Heyndrickxia sporothermodurans]MBL5771994.1 hypothetical protein [Heyndrickxia sporothermodurans]MBL5811440.1 hypothetical protein [Heyndrickxia sporothermodurans]MBL5832319.1 hypothetical protein [Heyndrickxia sporothermodurans]MBL5850892.1 hypothetical protein [Heyndrickxia sporothermodurans]MBL5866972.1 hypothetical protein [Heyndrickxia sporothermodurans]
MSRKDKKLAPYYGIIFKLSSDCLEKLRGIIHFIFEIGYNNKRIVLILKEAYITMGTWVIIAVAIAFLAAIFTAGYDDKPGTSK